MRSCRKWSPTKLSLELQVFSLDWGSPPNDSSTLPSPSLEVGECDWPWLGPCSVSQTCCCWMSRVTCWTCPRLPSCQIIFKDIQARYWLFLTIDPFSTKSPQILSTSTQNDWITTKVQTLPRSMPRRKNAERLPSENMIIKWRRGRIFKPSLTNLDTMLQSRPRLNRVSRSLRRCQSYRHQRPNIACISNLVMLRNFHHPSSRCPVCHLVTINQSRQSSTKWTWTFSLTVGLAL